eukprot:3330203-Rhodomonas_salina.1
MVHQYQHSDLSMDSDDSHSRGKKSIFAGFSSSFRSKKLNIDVGELSETNAPVSEQQASDSDDSRSRGRKSILSTLGSVFKSKKLDISELSQGNNSVAGHQRKGKQGRVSGMMAKLRGTKTQPETAHQPRDKISKSPKVKPERRDDFLGVAARDANGNVLPGIKQARLRAMQQDLLKLVKDAEKQGHIKVTRRKATEYISLPGHGILRLVPSSGASVPPV